MKLIINKNQLDEPPEIFLRHAGYAFIYDRQSGKESYVRRLGGGFYPRFHIYIEEVPSANSKQEENKIVFNLHLDQKQPSYSGKHAHNAEYYGEAAEGEMERIRGLISRNSHLANQDKEEGELLERIGESRDYKKSVKLKEKSWWRRLFS